MRCFTLVPDVKPFECSMCDYACRDSSTLRKHQDRHLGKKKMYPCKYCSRQCKSKKSLKLHTEERHFGVDVNRIPCDICGKMFKSTTHLTNHVNRVHARRYSCKCEICGAAISAKGNLLAHMRTHTDITPYKCAHPSCGKLFKRMDYLKKHSILHRPERHYACDICGHLFSRKTRLNSHLAQHQPKVKSAQCDLCGVRFYNANYVAAHMLRKHSGRRYECDECGFRTPNKPSLVMHIKHGHETENGKVCQICRRGFKNNLHLRQHYWNAHCVQYKKVRRRRRKKEIEETVIKQEMDTIPEIDLLEVHKEEIMSDVEADSQSGAEVEYTKREFRDDERMLEAGDGEDEERPEISTEVVVEKLEEVSGKVEEATEAQLLVEVDTGLEENAKRELETLLSKARREKKLAELEETRRDYNERIRRAIGEQPKTDRITNNDEDKSLNDNDAASEKETDGNDNEIDKAADRKGGKLKINTHQCYVCFKLFPTKLALTEHCQHHFDVCGGVMLKKCPMCDYATNLDLRRHMRLVHGVHVRLKHPRIKQTKENGSKFYYDLGNLGDVEVIPSARNLNRRECAKIDQRSRREREMTVAKKKLVKRGSEWVVETERLSVEEFLLPELAAQGDTGPEVGDDYLARLKRLSRLAKAHGAKMLFPCDGCPKICQTLSALKLHTRRHDPNKKPYKPKIWKHKTKTQNDSGRTGNGAGDDAEGRVGEGKSRPTSCKQAKAALTDKRETVAEAGEDAEGGFGGAAQSAQQSAGDTGGSARSEEAVGGGGASANRHAEPRPIVNRHRCDPALREFYARNVRGGDVEFHQFLKIYNRISREGGPPEDAACSPPIEGPPRRGKPRPVGVRKAAPNPHTRVVRVTRREHLARLEARSRLRRELEARSSGARA
ncbi:unnamed protein product, partial [Iphiclides podalirius]